MVATIPHPTPVLLTRVPTERHQYNFIPKRKLAYYFTQRAKFSLATDDISAMEENSVVQPVTGVYQ